MREAAQALLSAILAPVRATLSAVQSSQESKPKKKEGWKVRRVKQALKDLFPPDGHPPVDLPPKKILERVNGEFFKDLKPASRDTLARAIGLRRL
jgi:hypothetical protein